MYNILSPALGTTLKNELICSALNPLGMIFKSIKTKTVFRRFDIVLYLITKGCNWLNCCMQSKPLNEYPVEQVEH